MKDVDEDIKALIIQARERVAIIADNQLRELHGEACANCHGYGSDRTCPRSEDEPGRYTENDVVEQAKLVPALCDIIERLTDEAWLASRTAERAIADHDKIIAILRVELAETIEQRDELARRNDALLESHRRVFVATKPVLDAVKNLRDSDRADPLAVMIATADLLRAYNAYNPPREFEVYK